MKTSSNDRELRTSRLLRATPGGILEAFSDPECLARWWGPNGFRNIFHQFEFKPGGVWKYDMHGPDGAVYPNKSAFEELSPQRIVLRHLEPMHTFVLTLTMTPETGGTRLTWSMMFDSVEECDKVRDFCPRCNEENLDRLESELAGSPISNRELILTRIIHASPDKLFRAWTEPTLLTQWFTPPPFTTPYAELDVRPGGSNFVLMRGPDGTEMPNRGVYLEVIPNKRLVVTDAYTKAWEPSAHPFITIILTFEDAGDGKTNYTARVLHWNVADREKHEQMGFHQGWGIATDQLEALVAKL